MAGAYTNVDLSRLAPPGVVEQLDYETILAAMVANLQARDDSFNAIVESDPAYKILQVCAYRELVIRQRVNDAAKAVMLAYAGGTDLDHLGILFGVSRLVIDPGNPGATPPIEPSYEPDADLRRRIQLSLEGFSTAGPEGAYIFHALGAHGDVLDASATSPSPGDVLITVLSRNGDGTASPELLDAVSSVLSAEDVRPLTDHVTVQSAVIVPYAVDATLYCYAGPDRAVVIQSAQTAIETYVEAQHRLGLDVTLSGIYAALHQPGVQRVDLVSPAANILVNEQSTSYCTGINLLDGGLDE